MEDASTREFVTFEGFQEASGLEQHGILVDYDIFRNLEKPEYSPRDKPGPVYYAVDFSFELNPNSDAVDAGVVIPNVNDNYNGSAPDLGALEIGKDIPVYGVRGLPTDKAFYR